MNPKDNEQLAEQKKDGVFFQEKETMRISIVLYTTVKGFNYVERAIQSVLDQTYKNFELIIISDGAELKTLENLRKFKDERVQLIELTKIVGLGKALNIAFSRASGDYFTWIKDICFYQKNALENFVEYISAHPTFDFVYADYVLESPDNGQIQEIHSADYLDFVEENPMGPCFFYSRRLAQKLGGYKAVYEMSADYDYWIRLVKEYPIIHWEQSILTTLDIPYYGEKISRTRAYLLAKIIRYQYGFLKISQLERGVWDFQDRIKRHAPNWLSQVGLTLGIIPKAFCVSFKTGCTISGLMIYSAYKDYLEPPLKGLTSMFQQLKLFILSLSLKKSAGNKNVLCVIPEVVVGGSEKVVKDIIQETSKHGYSYHLLAIRGEVNKWVEEFLTSFLNVVLFDKNFNNYNKALDEQYYLYLSFLVKKLEIDVLLISNPHAAYRCLPRIKREFPHLKVVDLIHVEKFCASMEETFDAIPFIDKRICISHRLKAHMIDKYKQSHVDEKYIKHLEVIHNGNDMNEFIHDSSVAGRFKEKYQISSDTKIISYVGRLSSEKRPIVFVDAAKTIIDQAPDTNVKFVMAGDGLYMKAVKDRLTQHGIKDYFILPGMINSEEVKELLMDSFALLITSSIEGLPLVAVEAMAMSVPVISTDVGAVNEAICDGTSGYLVNPQLDVVKNLANKVIHLLTHSDVYNSMRAKTRTAVEQEFSLDVFGKKYLSVLNELSGKSK